MPMMPDNQMRQRRSPGERDALYFKIEGEERKKLGASTYFRKGAKKNYKHYVGIGHVTVDIDKDGSERIGLPYEHIVPFDLTKANRQELEALEPQFEKYSFEIAGAKNVSKIEYAPKDFVMRASFVNKGAVVVYDHVPPSVYLTLEKRAASIGYKTTDANSFGAYFWDVIRIHWRGNFVRLGSKYGFSYEVGGRTLQYTDYKINQDRQWGAKSVKKKNPTPASTQDTTLAQQKEEERKNLIKGMSGEKLRKYQELQEKRAVSAAEKAAANASLAAKANKGTGSYEDAIAAWKARQGK